MLRHGGHPGHSGLDLAPSGLEIGLASVPSDPSWRSKRLSFILIYCMSFVLAVVRHHAPKIVENHVFYSIFRFPDAPLFASNCKIAILQTYMFSNPLEIFIPDGGCDFCRFLGPPNGPFYRSTSHAKRDFLTWIISGRFPKMLKNNVLLTILPCIKTSFFSTSSFLRKSRKRENV